MSWPPGAGGVEPGSEPGLSVGTPQDEEFRGAPLEAGASRLSELGPITSFGERTVFLRMENGTSAPWEKAPAVPAPTGEALRRLGERMRSLMEATRDLVYMMAPDGTITLLSKSFETLTGWPRRRWLGKYFGPLIHPDDLPLAKETLTQLLRGEAPTPHELRLAKADGTYLDMEFVSSSVKSNGEVVEIVGSGRDMRERKEIECERANAREQRRAKEEAEAANRAKDEFLAALSHELRTPLTPVLSLATALEDEVNIPWPCQDAMKIVRRNVELEARLIDDLLDLTRIIRGKLHLQSQVVDVHRLLREVVEICEDDLGGKNLRTVVALDAKEAVVRGDPARLEQVFWNLIKNAVKFTPEGGMVRVSTSNVDGDERVVVRVSDTGVGVEPDQMGKIFEAFEQGGDAVTRQFGGLGLGLAIGKGIVEAHGGRITVESEGAGKGATFEVELATVPGGAEKVTEPAGKRSGRPVRILLVEDHADTARVMTTLLRGMGHEVDHVTSVRAALEVLGRKPCDLMISDLGLPDGTGWDLMRRAKQDHPEVRGIALSGYGMEQDLRKSQEAGFEEHVVKPFNFARLTDVIQAVAGE